jgi:phospholipid/cholesterol/gamma-HCH transport system substrate-binding protein
MLPYRVYFEDPVTDLADDAAVRINGVRIGSVNEVKLDPSRQHMAVATIEIRDDIVITKDSTATLETEGLVGPAYVGISSGRVDAPPLRHDGPEPPVIPYERSSLNQLMETLPEQVSEIAANIETISGEISQNREAIGSLIIDAASTVSSLDRASEEVVALTGEAGQAVQRANDLIAQLDEALGERLEPMMANAEKTASALAGAAGEAEKLIAETRGSVDQFATQGLGEMRQLLSETRRMVDNLTSLVAQLERHPSSILFGAPEPTFRPEAR